MWTFDVVFFNHYWNRVRSFGIIVFFKHVGKTKYAVLYYYRYLIIMLQTSNILKLINKKL